MRKSALLLVLPGLLLSGCGQPSQPAPTSPTGAVLTVLSLPAEVKVVHVNLIGPESREIDLPVDASGKATTTFTNLLAGSYTVTARGFDQPDRLVTLYKARAVTTFAAPLTLKMNRLTSAVVVSAQGAQAGLLFSAKVGGSLAGLKVSGHQATGTVPGVPTGRDQVLLVEGRNSSGLLMQQGQVNLTVSESDVQANVTLSTLTYQPPEAPSLSGATTVKRNEPYTLNLTATNPGDSDLKTVRVDWGDGSAPLVQAVSGKSVSLTPTHTYTASGTQTVTVTTTNAAGLSGSATLTVNVLPTVDGTLTVDSGEELSNLSVEASGVPESADRVQVTLSSATPLSTASLRPLNLQDVTVLNLARDDSGRWTGNVSLPQNTTYRADFAAFQGSTQVASLSGSLVRPTEASSSLSGTLGPGPASPTDPVRVVASFDGTSSPTAQGWTASVSKAGSAGGELVQDGGQSAWKVDGVAGRSQFLYTPSALDRDAGSMNGWRLRTTMRMESGSYINDYYANGTRRFLPTLGLSSGKLVISLEGGGSNIVLATGTAATAYHDYVQEFDPATGQVSLTFDGVRVATWSGAATTQNYVAWGDGSTGIDSVAYYRRVSFEVNRAPSTTLLERDVFVGSGESVGGSPSYRIPALGVLPSGTLLAAAEGRLSAADPGTANEPINISFKRSTDGGRTWSAVQRVVSDPAYDYSDPRFVVDAATGTAYLFFVRWPDNCGQNANCNPPGLDDPKVTVLFYVKSTDDGRTWSAPVNVNAMTKDPTWRTLNPGPGHGVQLGRQSAAQGGHNGRLLFPAIVRDGSSNFYNASIISDDGGATWRHGALTPAAGPTEADLIELADGRLLLSARNDGSAPGSRFHFFSSDGGETWQQSAGNGGISISKVDASLLTLPQNGQGVVALTGPLGDLSNGSFSGTSRNNLGIWLSDDQGQTFPRFRHLAYGPAGYSSAVALPSGDLGVLYEATGSTLIHFSRIPAGSLSK